MPKTVFTAFALAAVAVIALAAPLAVSLSLLAAGVAGALPQAMAFFIYERSGNRRPFSFWAVKFSLTILLLALSLRALHDSGLLSPSYFIAGLAAALAFNFMLSLRFSRQSIDAR